MLAKPAISDTSFSTCFPVLDCTLDRLSMRPWSCRLKPSTSSATVVTDCLSALPSTLLFRLRSWSRKLCTSEITFAFSLAMCSACCCSHGPISEPPPRLSPSADLLATATGRALIAASSIDSTLTVSSSDFVFSAPLVAASSIPSIRLSISSNLASSLTAPASAPPPPWTPPGLRGLA